MTSDSSFFYEEQVENSCYQPIKERIQTLLDKYKKIQQDMADDLGIDKAYVSRIVNGIVIPPHHLRLKIAAYFEIDTTAIWRIQDTIYVQQLMKEMEGKKDGD